MTTLRAPDREFHTLAAGDVLTVVTAAASAGIVRQYPDTGFNATSSQPVGAASTLTVGPFTGAVRLGVECSRGELDWTAGLPASFPARALSDTKVAAVDSLVSGGGIGVMTIAAPDGTDVGDVLTATPNTGWTVGGYQWTRDGADIGGQTSSTYTVVFADTGKLVGCKATSATYSALLQIPAGAFPAGYLALDGAAIAIDGAVLSLV